MEMEGRLDLGNHFFIDWDKYKHHDEWMRLEFNMYINYDGPYGEVSVEIDAETIKKIIRIFADVQGKGILDG